MIDRTERQLQHEQSDSSVVPYRAGTFTVIPFPLIVVCYFAFGAVSLLLIAGYFFGVKG